MLRWKQVEGVSSTASFRTTFHEANQVRQGTPAVKKKDSFTGPLAPVTHLLNS